MRAITVTTRCVLLLALTVLVVSLACEAQAAENVARIGILRVGSPPDPLVEGFRHGLRELGYVEGRNIIIEYRWAEGRGERLPSLATDLVGLKVDVILTTGTPSVLAAKQATTEIPIVMASISDPVRHGIVASLARPGGNVTGFTVQNDELPGKWMQLLKEAVPRASRVAVLETGGPSEEQVRTSEAAARSLGVKLHRLKVTRADDFAPAFAAAKRSRVDALIVLGSPFSFAHRTRLVELAASHRLPTMFNNRESVVGSGGLMSYGPDFHDLFRRAATYVDKILKGAKPGDLPIEQASKFELVINLRTAKALGLTIPPSLLQRADQVIE